MKKIYILLITLLVLFGTSCEDFVDGYDDSPNSPTNVTPGVLLTAAEAATIFAYTSQSARAASIFVQQSAGVTDQSKDDYQLYGMTENTVGNEWNGLYTDLLETADFLEATYAEENPYYGGMAKMLKALGIGMVTDFWGDVPFSEAFDGRDGVTAPAADAQESIIAAIQQLCTDAIADFQMDASANAFTPLEDDVIHGGDVEMWEIGAWILKARYANRLSNRDATGSATDALSYLDQAYAAGLDGNADNTLAPTGNASTDLNQWQAFQNNRGYMRAGATLVNMMIAQNDPRLPYYFADLGGGTFVGSDINEDNAAASNFGTWVMADAQAFPLLTYFEAKFIEAEAALRSNDDPRAAAAFNDAVIASVEFFTGSAPDAAFITNVASETAATITLETIMTQKYIAMFTQPEVWSDYRRTGYPVLTSDPRGAINQVPERYPTTLNERLYNPNITSITDLTVPVWWAE